MFNKKIKLTAYTYENDIFINEKPTFNKTDQVEWMKLLPSSYERFDPNLGSTFEVATAKNCPGINNFISSGIKFKMWTHLKIRVHPSGAVQELPGTVKGTIDPFAQHPREQYEHIYQRGKTAFKLNNPWIMACNQDVKFLFVESHYSTHFMRENNIYIAPGIIDYKYQRSTNIHLVLDVKETAYDLTIPYGTPLVTLFPLTERKIDMDWKILPKEEFDKVANIFPRCPMRKYYQLIKNLN